MEGNRRRIKGSKPNQRLTDTRKESNNTKIKDPSLHNWAPWSWNVFGILMVFSMFVSLIVYCMFAPPPKFPKEVQYWHDNGYLFKFREHNIHFQDIPRKKESFLFTPVLLVIHGYPTSSYDWKDLIQNFHERFGRIIIPDLLGFGFSDKPTGYKYSIKEQATMLEELLNHLNISDVHILAHDYGDSVAQELIARADDSMYNLKFNNIKSVCLTNGGIIPSQHNARPIQKLLSLPFIKTVSGYFITRFIFNSRLSAIFGPNTQPSQKYLEEFWCIILHKRGNMVLSALLNYIPERRENEQRWVDALRKTSIPLHLIYGPLDPINTPEGFLKSYKSLVPQSSITVLENIGHYPQIEDGIGFMKSYNGFLNVLF